MSCFYFFAFICALIGCSPKIEHSDKEKRTNSYTIEKYYRYNFLDKSFKYESEEGYIKKDSGFNYFKSCEGSYCHYRYYKWSSFYLKATHYLVKYRYDYAYPNRGLGWQLESSAIIYDKSKNEIGKGEVVCKSHNGEYLEDIMDISIDKIRYQYDSLHRIKKKTLYDCSFCDSSNVYLYYYQGKDSLPYKVEAKYIEWYRKIDMVPSDYTLFTYNKQGKVVQRMGIVDRKIKRPYKKRENWVYLTQYQYDSLGRIKKETFYHICSSNTSVSKMLNMDFSAFEKQKKIGKCHLVTGGYFLHEYQQQDSLYFPSLPTNIHP